MTNINKNKMIVEALGGVFIFIYVFSFSILAHASEITPENIVQVINLERQANGIAPLAVNNQLQTAARNKSVDMIVHNYFDHYAFGKTPWSFILAENYNYQVAGENLAMGFRTSEGVVNAWMNSPTHRANILNSEFQEIGVGVVKGAYTEDGQTGETTMTTEITAAPKSKVSQLLDKVISTISNIFK